MDRGFLETLSLGFYLASSFVHSFKGNGSPKANPARATSKEEEKYCRTSFQSPKAKLQRRKWEKLGTYPAPANISMVREFYCNARQISTTAFTFTSHVRGLEVKFDADTINTFLGTILIGANLVDRQCQYTHWKNHEKNYNTVLRIIRKSGAKYQTTKKGTISPIKR
ncbi:hypothetical protein E2542_SST20324 [Spatholobus suberectus]|nr:hypothetical protein E2542_SST20324 [Spatholobus suberectus]